MSTSGGPTFLGRSRGAGQSKSAEQPTAAWFGKNVLIVDDLATVRDMLQRIYEAIGMHVVGTAANGVEALAFLESNSVDLVSLDIIMPEMDGIECYRKIRARGLPCRSVFISWLAADPRVPERLKEEIPLVLFQGKPVDAASLSDRLNLVFAFPAGGMPDRHPEDERVAI